MRKQDVLSFLSSVLFLLPPAHAQVTLYNNPGQSALGTATTTATGAETSYTGLPAYDPLVLTPPPLPDPRPALDFVLQVHSGPSQPGLSIPLEGNVFGFSIEMSVLDMVLGRNSSFINVPFLNLMGNIAKRGGKVQLRIGGNTQETAVLVPDLADGRAIEKDHSRVYNPTETPPMVFTPEIIYMMGNISELVPVEWFIGIPLNDTTQLRLGIAEAAQEILGDKLIGMQIGNEPDLYARHGHRPETYTPEDFNNEFQLVIDALAANPRTQMRNLLVGPSICTGDWTPELMFSTGFIDRFPDLKIVSVERYPDNNCWAKFGVGAPRFPQDAFTGYLTHRNGQGMAGFYAETSRLAIASGKPVYLFETNTASCGGFPGASDSFGAALWGIDYAMQLAFTNFSGVLMHVGGQNVNYNPFTPPPTRLSNFRRWTIGPVYYSAMIMAEALGSTGTAQVADLFANGDAELTPGYVIYENGVPARFLLINFMTDQSGASAYTATLAIGGGDTFTPGAAPPQVWVKYFTAASVAQKGEFNWAGQTFGGNFASDGRLMGEEHIDVFPCDQATATCRVSVPAPGAALVFLSEPAIREVEASVTMTFATTAVTKLQNTATVDAEVLATSNGHGGRDRQMGSTSRGSSGATGMNEGLRSAGWVIAALAVVVGAAAVRW